MVQLLLVKGADKDALDNQVMTPQYLAGYQGHVAAAINLALLGAGVPVNVRCGEFKSPVVHAAAQAEQDEI